MEWNQERQQAASRYAALLGDVPAVVLPTVSAGNDHVWHLYVVRVPDRDRVLRELGEAGIAAGIHYPTPIHLLPAFGFLGHRVGDFPMAERVSAEILSLPIFPGITADQQVLVAEVLRAAVAGKMSPVRMAPSRPDPPVCQRAAHAPSALRPVPHRDRRHPQLQLCSISARGRAQRTDPGGRQRRGDHRRRCVDRRECPDPLPISSPPMAGFRFSRSIPTVAPSIPSTTGSSGCGVITWCGWMRTIC